VLEVADDGPGLPPGWNADRDGGVGLRNVAARLAQRYGAAHRLEFLTGLNDRGLTVRITIPYRPPGELAS
jgi:sensor histidine kinase YesM